jgi:hypothetical protein
MSAIDLDSHISSPVIHIRGDEDASDSDRPAGIETAFRFRIDIVRRECDGANSHRDQYQACSAESGQVLHHRCSSAGLHMHKPVEGL